MFAIVSWAARANARPPIPRPARKVFTSNPRLSQTTRMMNTMKNVASVLLISGMKAATCSLRALAPSAKWSTIAPPAQASPQSTTTIRAPRSPRQTRLGTVSQNGITVSAAMIPQSITKVAAGASRAGSMSLFFALPESLTACAKKSLTPNLPTRNDTRRIRRNATHRLVVLSIASGKNLVCSPSTRRSSGPGGCAGTGTAGMRAMAGHCQSRRRPQRQAVPQAPKPMPSASRTESAAGPFRARNWATALACVLAGLGFGAVVWLRRGAEPAQQYLAGYLIELSLSVDNVFVFALVFEQFGVAPARQRRLLFWGIAGAIVLRSAIILAGIGAIGRFAW